MRIRPLSVPILATILLLPAVVTESGGADRKADSGAAKPGVYSIGTEAASSIMGCSGVPAAVVTKSGTRRGFFLTRATVDGMWRSMGLSPGDVLLTLDNRVICSGADADACLRSMKPHSIDVQFMHKTGDDGRYSLKSRRFLYGGPAAAAVMGSSGSSGSSGNSSASSSGTLNYGKTNLSTSPASSPGAMNTGNSSIADLESYMLGLVNQDRRAVAHVNALPMDSRLSAAARAYAEDMLKRNFFSHTDPNGKGPQERARDAGIRCGIYENLSFQQGRGWRTDKEMVAAAEAEMMSEPPDQHNHRSTILHPHHVACGIGIARDGTTVTMVQWYTDSQP